MAGLMGRRKTRSVETVRRAVVEMLEGRTFFDVATFSVTDSSVGQSYGVTNQASAPDNWTQQYTVTQGNVPDHSHTIAAIHANVMVNVNPITGQCVDDFCCGGCCSGGDDSSDYGWIKVYCNGQLVQDNEFGSGTPTTSDNYYGGVFLDQGAQTDSWEIDTSSNVWISVDTGEITTGTYAGFGNTVEADRGGQDGSVQMKLDGTTGGGSNVYIQMPSSGVLNLGGTPDDQLPDAADGTQPYFTITGPQNIELDSADSRPDLGWNVYTVPAADTTITFHMVDPYTGGSDYQDGIYVSVIGLQPAANVIPVQGAWWDANANEFWTADAAPDAKGLYVRDDVEGEMTDARMDELVAQLNSIDSVDRASAKAALIQEVQACPSAHVLTRLWGAGGAPGIGPQQQTLLASINKTVNPAGITFNLTDGGIIINQPVDNNHVYDVGTTSIDNSMETKLLLANGGGLVDGPRVFDPGTPLPTIVIYPMYSGTGKLTVTLDESVLQPDGTWKFLGEVSTDMWFRVRDDPNQ
jgi:hypothetical protein